MEIKAITKYLYKGKEYKSLQEIQNEIHNTIGLELLDKMQRTCPLEKHRDYEKLLALLCSPEIRTMLTDCLNVTFNKIDEDGDEETINILDL